MKIVTILLILFFTSPKLYGNQLVAGEELNILALLVNFTNTDGSIGSLVQICKGYHGSKACKVFPDNQNYLFRGDIPAWGQFFNRCSNFDDNNTLSDVTLAIATLAFMPSLGVLKTIVAETAVNITVDSPYPDVEERALIRALEMVLYLMKDENKRKRLDPKYLISLERILQICSTGFNQFQIRNEYGACMRGCHGSNRGQKDNRK